jgi:hypothetical protein
MSARLQIHEIPVFLEHYNRDYSGKDDDLIARRKRIRRERKMRLADLCAVCLWKAPRAAGRARKNTNMEVEELTCLALRANSERVRVEVLQTLHGASYPTASVILHFYHTDTYPILDVRALWSMGISQLPQYTFEFWWNYVGECRKMFARARRRFPKLSMRELDRALWQYSYEKQLTS